MTETVAYFEVDGQAFVVYSELCTITTSTLNSSISSLIASSSSLQQPSGGTTNYESCKKIKLTLSDGQNMYYNHNDIQYKPNNNTSNNHHSNNNTNHSNEFNLFQIIHSSIVKQDSSKFKYRLNYQSNGNINFIISMIVNPSGDYILSNIELTKSSNTKTGHLSLFRYLINCKENDEKTIQKLSKQSKHYNECIEQSKKVIEEKDKMEKELYSQFIILLNSKKEAIRKYNTNKNQTEELLEKEKDKNRKLNDENKKLQAQIEELKKLKFKNTEILNPSPKNGYLNNNTNSNYQTPRKQSKNLTSFDAEDLLEDLSFE